LIALIQVIYGPKGTGKTKAMVESANRMSNECKGTVVFIDNSNERIYDLKHKIRFTNVSEYPVKNIDSLTGFVCGILSQDYDAEYIYIDSLSYILGDDIERLEEFFNAIEKLTMPQCVKKYLA
jgi:thymidine kinase